MNDEQIIQELLDEGSDDWVTLNRVVGLTAPGVIDDEGKARVVRVLERLYNEGLMVPGTLELSGFVKWAVPASEYLPRSIAELERLNWVPKNEGFWLDLTDLGEERASTTERLSRVESEFHPLLLEGTDGDTATAMYRWSEAGLTVRAVRGRKMRSRVGLFDEFAAALQFPLYFGENAAAFSECIRDLDDSLPIGRGYVIVVIEPDQLLADAIDQFEWLAHSLADASEALGAPIELGGSFDRPAVPFHVVLAGERGVLDRAAKRWAEAGIKALGVEPGPSF